MVRTVSEFPPALDLVMTRWNRFGSAGKNFRGPRGLRWWNFEGCVPKDSGTEQRPSLQGAVDKAALLEPIRARVAVCIKCPHLARTRTQTVFGVGNPEAELMFIGEAPGADEDARGEPFVGRAGQLLTKIIETMGFKRATFTSRTS